MEGIDQQRYSQHFGLESGQSARSHGYNVTVGVGPMRIPKKSRLHARQSGAGFQLRQISDVRGADITVLKHHKAALSTLVSQWLATYQSAFECQQADMLGVIHDQGSAVEESLDQPEHRSALVFCALDLLNIYSELIKGTSSADLYKRRKILHWQWEIRRLFECGYFGARAREACAARTDIPVLDHKSKAFYNTDEWLFRAEVPKSLPVTSYGASDLPDQQALSARDAQVLALFTSSDSHRLDDLESLLKALTQFYQAASEILQRRYERNQRDEASLGERMLAWLGHMVGSDEHVPPSYTDARHLFTIKGRCIQHFVQQLEFMEKLVTVLQVAAPSEPGRLRQYRQSLLEIADCEQVFGREPG